MQLQQGKLSWEKGYIVFSVSPSCVLYVAHRSLMITGTLLSLAPEPGSMNSSPGSMLDYEEKLCRWVPLHEAECWKTLDHTQAFSLCLARFLSGPPLLCAGISHFYLSLSLFLISSKFIYYSLLQVFLAVTFHKMRTGTVNKETLKEKCGELEEALTQMEKKFLSVSYRTVLTSLEIFWNSCSIRKYF